MKKQNNKFEFSKLILAVGYLTATFFTGVAAIIAIENGDIGSFANIVAIIWTTLGVAVNFYYWKAKAENLIKMAKEMPQDKIDNLDEIKSYVE